MRARDEVLRDDSQFSVGSCRAPGARGDHQSTTGGISASINITTWKQRMRGNASRIRGHVILQIVSLEFGGLEAHFARFEYA